MKYETEELLGQNEDLSAVHAMKTGAHDAVATVVQYGTIAGIVAVVGYLLLDEKTRNRLKKRWL